MTRTYKHVTQITVWGEVEADTDEAAEHAALTDAIEKVADGCGVVYTVDVTPKGDEAP